jgi:hypothetical protein
MATLEGVTTRVARRRTTGTSKRSIALRKGFRSGLEESVAESLKERAVPFFYEQHVLSYTRPSSDHTYRPDFVLNNGIVIETKGHFTNDDRKKHLWIRECNPGVDLRFVFSRSSQKIRKGAKSSYADWCKKHGFKYADRDIPDEWIAEKPNKETTENDH